VLDSTAVSDSNLAGPSNTRNGWRMPASRDRLVARCRCGGFYRRLAKAVKPRPGLTMRRPLSGPKGGC